MDTKELFERIGKAETESALLAILEEVEGMKVHPFERDLLWLRVEVKILELTSPPSPQPSP